jgi:uncharacterized membrane protein
MSVAADPLIAAAVNAFDLKAAILARHAQHPVIVHFPIALFITSVIFEILGAWRRQPIFGAVAYYNLLGAALSLPFTIATGFAAWQMQLEGARLKGNLQLHLICALTTAVLILGLWWRRRRLRFENARPNVSYFVVMAVALMMITLTGHLGGIVSGVETP